MSAAPKPAKWWYNVNPRYTCGSPAQVPEMTAREVAKQEADGYDRALSGVYGEAEKNFATACGLSGVVFRWREKGKRVLVEDLATGLTYDFPRWEAFVAWSSHARLLGHRMREVVR